MDLLQVVATILSFESVRWSLTIAFVIRMVSVSIINHLTWRKLFSLSLILLVTGPLIIVAISILDILLTTVDFKGYPETFIALFYLIFLLAQLTAKILLVSIDFEMRKYDQIRKERIAQLQIKAERFNKLEQRRNILKG